MSDADLLDSPWPHDLDPATVPFKVRTETVLRRAGYYDHPEKFDTLTEADVMAWWNAGVTTVADIRLAGNRAMRLHHEDTDPLSDMNVALAAVASEPWARHIWHRDPRVADHLPEVDMTVHDIAASGAPDVRHSLWTRLDSLRSAVAAQSALSLSEAIARYVGAISGQHGRRLEVLLARTGLNGRDPISGPKAARMLGVSTARMYQIQNTLERYRLTAQPPDGIWMPQVTIALEHGWPAGYTKAGSDAICAFCETSPAQRPSGHEIVSGVSARQRLSDVSPCATGASGLQHFAPSRGDSQRFADQRRTQIGADTARDLGDRDLHARRLSRGT